MAQQDEQHAMELAEVLAREEEWQQELYQHDKKLEDYEQRLMQSLKSTAHKLEQYRAELRMAKATEQAQQAAGKLSKQANLHSDRFAQMQDSLERIKQRQADFADQMRAAEEVDAGLASRPTEKQRIKVKAEAVLARFKAA